MRKLFRAAFYRTENKKMIRIELVIAVLLSAFIILNGYFQTNLTNAYIYKLASFLNHTTNGGLRHGRHFDLVNLPQKRPLAPCRQ